MDRNNFLALTQPISHLLHENKVTWKCLWKWRKLHWKAKKRNASHKSLGKFHDKFLVSLDTLRPNLCPVNPWAMCVVPKDTLVSNHRLWGLWCWWERRERWSLSHPGYVLLTTSLAKHFTFTKHLFLGAQQMDGTPIQNSSKFCGGDLNIADADAAASVCSKRLPFQVN